MTPRDLVDCPAACGNKVHADAGECPHCGHRAAMSRLEDLLGGLGTVCSILVGFGLAALVQLASGDEKARNDPWLSWAAAVWIVASVLLLAVLVGAEMLRRREVPGGRMTPRPGEDERLWRRGERLLMTFAFALLCTAAGVLLLGFWFSWWHGL